jgi:sugar lactone lactonase YvrE
MKSRWISLVVFLSFTTLLFSLAPKSLPNLQSSSAWGDEDILPFPKDATFTTLITTPRAIEGLTGDNEGNLYTGGSGAPPCPVWQININKPDLIPVGFVVPTAPAPTNCAFTGIAFDEAGNLYVADGAAGIIYFFNPSAKNPPTAAIFAQGVPGTNALAFDRRGNLWTGDGTTGQGRVWKITSPGANCTPQTLVNCEEVFRIQPMNNGSTFGGTFPLDPGVGRVNATMQPNGVPANNPQNLVANGIAFNRVGDMFIIDTARGALWKIKFDLYGNLRSPTGCDTTFTPNTLCLSNVFVAHPILEGGDGIALDVFGNIWVDANERNAVAFVTRLGKVFEVFRNPVNSSGLRNSADTAEGNTRILEFPTSPFITGKLFCTSQSDGNRRDNSPNTAGQVSPNGPEIGKISCMDQELTIRGLRLPVE